jgi:DNA-binding transcriptional ArsR family regulator
MSPADESPILPDFRPEPLMRVASLEVLRAISDPTRMRLIETMGRRQDPPWSVRELAAALAVPQTRLYHHIELLLAHGIVVPVERRVVSGIIETRYRIAALNFQLDRRMFRGDRDEATRAIHDTIATVFDTARDEIEAAMRSEARDPSEQEPEPDAHRVMVVRSGFHLSPARAAELRRRLSAVMADFDHETTDDASTPETEAWGLVLALYPLAHEAKEPSDG